MDQRGAVISSLLGGAIGDALGMPFERVSKAKIEASVSLPLRTYCDPVHGAPCREFGLTRGMYTDDTQAVRATARAAAEHRCVSPRIVADALSAWLFDDSLGQEPRYPGQTTRTAMSRYRTNGDPGTCGVLSQNCGAAIRISPVAIWLTIQGENGFADRVRDCARVTHRGDSAVDGALIVASLIRGGLHGETPGFDSMIDMCTSDRMTRALHLVAAALTSERDDTVVANELAEALGGSERAHEVVPLALVHLYRARFDFRETLERGLDTLHPDGIDMDSILSVAGAISGVHCAAQVEGSDWLTDLEDAELIAEEASRLHSAAAQ